MPHGVSRDRDKRGGSAGANRDGTQPARRRQSGRVSAVARTYPETAQAAQRASCSVYADDRYFRRLLADNGVPSFATVALLRSLHEAGAISNDAHATALALPSRPQWHRCDPAGLTDAPMAAPGNYSFARAVREHAFVQVPLLHLSEFRTAAKARGLETLGVLDNDPWETLDRERLMMPVAYALHGFAWRDELHRHLADGALLIREEVGHRR
jgi:hypothetical protein